MPALIHRYSLNGNPRCGAKPDKFGHLRISASGVCVTCPDCLRQPNHQEQLATLERAAKQYRKAHRIEED